MRAAREGADLVELDIRLSLDRRPVVTHDAFLGRSTHGHGWVRLWPSFLLRRMKLRLRADEDHDERVPTLRDVLFRLPVGIQPALHLKDRAALIPVLNEIRRSGQPDRTWLWLEHPQDVTRALTTLPQLRCTLLRPNGWTPENRHAYMRDARSSAAHAVSLPWGMIDKQLSSLAHQHGLLIFSREQDSPSIANRIAIGVDGIITDDPGSARKCIEAALSGSPAAR